jgi:hypothetical protein
MARFRLWILLVTSFLAGSWVAGCRAYVDDADTDAAPDAAVDVDVDKPAPTP